MKCQLAKGALQKMLNAIFDLDIIYTFASIVGHYWYMIPATLLFIFVFFGMHRTIRATTIYYGITMISLALKIIISAPRPEGSWIQDGRSFPSGHTMIAMVLALFIIAYAVKNRHQLHMLLRVSLVTVGVLIAFIGGYMRTHIGVHTIWEVLGTQAMVIVLFFAIGYLFDYIVNRWIGKWRIWKFLCRYEGVPKLIKNKMQAKKNNDEAQGKDIE